MADINKYSTTEIFNRSYNEDYTCLDVQEVDHTSDIYGFPFLKAVTPFTLATDVVVNTKTIELNTGHGIIAGNEIFMTCCDEVFYAKVISVDTNVLTLDRYTDFAYLAVSTIGFKVISNMNVDGSTTNQIFTYAIGATATKSVDIVTIRFTIVDETAMDDGKFGGITALTNGIFLRIKHVHDEVVEYHNMWNAKTNGDLKLKINNSSYSDKAPAGQYSFFAEWKLKDATGNVVRLNPGESLELLVQDNLLALISFEAYINGHEVD